MVAHRNDLTAVGSNPTYSAMKIKVKTYVKKPNEHRGNDPYYQTREWAKMRDKIIIRDKGLCQEHKRQGIVMAAGKYRTVDHIVPRNRGGSDTEENLELLCKKCHDIKSAKEKNQIVK